jgi:hypothetical protein
MEERKTFIFKFKSLNITLMYKPYNLDFSITSIEDRTSFIEKLIREL